MKTKKLTNIDTVWTAIDSVMAKTKSGVVGYSSSYRTYRAYIQPGNEEIIGRFPMTIFALNLSESYAAGFYIIPGIEIIFIAGTDVLNGTLKISVKNNNVVVKNTSTTTEVFLSANISSLL